MEAPNPINQPPERKPAPDNTVQAHAKRLGEGHTVAGFLGRWRDHTVTERQALEMFRTFTPQEIADAISTHILQKPVEHGHKTISLEQYIQTCHDPSVIEDTPYEITEHIKQGRPDVYNLYHLYEYIVSQSSKALVDGFPERFAFLINQESLSIEDHEKMIEKLGATANLGALRLTFPAAFTPQNRRGEMRSFKDPFSVHDFLQIHDYTPDVITGNTTPEMRLDAFARMLFLPRTLSLTHEDHERALIAVCEQRGIDPTSLPKLKETDRATFAAIHKEAGLFMRESMLQHARHSLVATLHNDAQESAHGSIYTYATRIKDNLEETAPPQLTERAHCTGADLHDSLTQGIGLALQNNRELVLRLMETTTDPLLQLDVQQRNFFDDFSSIVNGVKNRQGAYSNPKYAEGNKQFAIKEITQELKNKDLPAHYREMLQEVLTIAQDLEIE